MKFSVLNSSPRSKNILPRISNGVKKGFALITVLAVLIMIALGTATILQSVGNITSVKSNNLQEAKAKYLAEAGMQYAVWVCRTSGCAAIPASITIDGTNVVITKTVASGVYTIKAVPADYTNA